MFLRLRSRISQSYSSKFARSFLVEITKLQWCNVSQAGAYSDSLPIVIGSYGALSEELRWILGPGVKLIFIVAFIAGIDQFSSSLFAK